MCNYLALCLRQAALFSLELEPSSLSASLGAELDAASVGETRFCVLVVL